MGGNRPRRRRLSTLADVLEEARRRGYLGPGPITRHIGHAESFAEVIDAPPGHGLDLGSGGGVPGLVLAARWPDTRWVLLDAGRRRAAFLDHATVELGLRQVTVVHGRAEVAGRDPALRGNFDVVCARSFGRPAVTAECASPFLAVGGRLVVSDPPRGDGERWPNDQLARLGLAVHGHPETAGAHFTVLAQHQACPEEFPRRPGVPVRRPLF